MELDLAAGFLYAGELGGVQVGVDLVGVADR